MPDSASGSTNIRVSEETHERLQELKPYDSMTFDELIAEMADQYEPPVRAR